MNLIPREMITAYATLKKVGARTKLAAKRLDDQRHGLIAHIGTEILTGRPEFLNAWMTGSGTQFNVNEGVSDRCWQLAGTTLGGKTPVHPVDYVNMSLSPNDSFPSAISA
jgi:fumarate hydratase class II